MDSVGREAQRVVDTYDKRLEGETIADQAQIAVAAAAAGRRCRGRPRHDRDHRSVNRCGGHHRDPARQRRAGRWIPDHPRPTPAGEGDAAREDCRAPDSALYSTPNRIRASAGTERASTRRRDCALRALRTRRRATLDGCSAYSGHSSGPDDGYACPARTACGRSVNPRVVRTGGTAVSRRNSPRCRTTSPSW